MDGMLSQEEINALLNGMQDDNSDLDEGTEVLSDEEKDAIGEISNISMGTAATTLSTLVNRKVMITTPVVSYATWEEISTDYKRPCVFVQISYKEGLEGNNILILEEHDVKVITDLMMGGNGLEVSGELSELHLSAISEAMNQMMGSAATSISSMLSKKVDISPPVANLVDLNGNIPIDDLPEFLNGRFVKVSFRMEIEGLIDSQIMQLYPFEFARDLYRMFSDNLHADKGSDTAPLKDAPQETPVQPQPTPQMDIPTQQAQASQSQQMMGNMPQQMMGMPTQGVAPQGIPSQMMNNMWAQPQMQLPPQQYMMPPVQDINVQPAQFTPFSNMTNPSTSKENIDLIMDVPLEVTVELGRTNKSIKEILDFKPGTIIELNKIAGEPIDVLVNGKYVAKGEVVVIEECFGIRVTEIIN